MNCPKCNSDNIETVAGVPHCRDCGDYFSAAPIDRTPVFSPGQISAAAIRAQAGQFTITSFALVALGAVLAILAAFGDAIWVIILGASMIGAGFWLFLIAQIMHIRANTEK